MGAGGEQVQDGVGDIVQHGSLNFDEIRFVRNDDLDRIGGVAGRFVPNLILLDWSKTWGKDGWKKVAVCIVSDERAKIDSRTLSASLL